MYFAGGLDNPVPVAPPPQPLPVSETITTSTSWTVPDGVEFVLLELYSGSGAGHWYSVPGNNGSDTTVSGGFGSLTAEALSGNTPSPGLYVNNGGPPRVRTSYGDICSTGYPSRRVCRWVTTLPGEALSITIGAGGVGPNSTANADGADGRVDITYFQEGTSPFPGKTPHSQEFTSSGTLSIPDDVDRVQVMLSGGGGEASVHNSGVYSADGGDSALGQAPDPVYLSCYGGIAATTSPYNYNVDTIWGPCNENGGRGQDNWIGVGQGGQLVEAWVQVRPGENIDVVLGGGGSLSSGADGGAGYCLATYWR